jgi:NADH-quinone oxidoreductase subunit N
VDLREILKVNKLIAFIFAMFIFSLAGLPPFAGFCGKFFIFLAMIKQGEYLYVVILFLFSILTAVYYLRLIRFLYFSNQFSLINMQNIKISAIVSFIIVIFFLINIFLFLFQAPLILVITNLIIENLFLDK